MPLNYPNPNQWIRPADPAGAYAKGFGLGNQAGQAQAHLAMQRAQLDEAQQRTALSFALQQQQMEKESMLAQQRLEVDKAYKSQQFSLGQQELGIKEQELQQKIKQAAAMTIARERFQQDLRNNVSPVQATLRHLAGFPEFGTETSTALREGTGPGAHSAFGKLLSDLKIAQQSGDAQEIDYIKQKIAKEMTPTGFTFESTPGGGFKMVQGGGGATTAMQTQGQEKLAQYENSIEAIQKLQERLQPGDVGIRGKLGEVVVDKTLAQFLPGAAVGSRISARTAIGLLRANLLRQVTDETGGRSSVFEREELKDALPEKGAIESYDDVMGKLAEIRSSLQDRSKVYAKTIGKPMPLWALTPDELKSLYRQKPDLYNDVSDVLERFHGGTRRTR